MRNVIGPSPTFTNANFLWICKTVCAVFRLLKFKKCGVTAFMPLKTLIKASGSLNFFQFHLVLWRIVGDKFSRTFYVM